MMAANLIDPLSTKLYYGILGRRMSTFFTWNCTYFLSHNDQYKPVLTIWGLFLDSMLFIWVIVTKLLPLAHLEVVCR